MEGNKESMRGVPEKLEQRRIIGVEWSFGEASAMRRRPAPVSRGEEENSETRTSMVKFTVWLSDDLGFFTWLWPRSMKDGNLTSTIIVADVALLSIKTR